MHTKIPRCQRCGTAIPPEEAVPYLDRFGNPIPGEYRNWCLYHWANRIGALPPGHPDFFKPRDPRTKRKDTLHLAQTVGHARLYGQSGIAPHLMEYSQAAKHEIETVRIPPRPSISNYFAKAQGFASLFPDFEQLGAWLGKLTSEERIAIEEDFDANRT